jgi:hypothetical protein
VEFTHLGGGLNAHEILTFIIHSQSSLPPVG